MSPNLFVLCMEKLALMIQDKVQDNKWKPVKVSKNGPAISYLFFVDDCLLFTQAKSSHGRLVKEVLDAFCHASGLKVSIQKTRFMAFKNMSRGKISKFAAAIDFHHTSNLGKYLGFPLLTGRVKKADFGFILDKINSRLAGWQGKLLNRVGRVTLANSVLTSIPIYLMQNNWLPEGVCDALDANIRRFIWRGRSCHWVNWDTITQPKTRGGLGIHNARESNISLLGKYIWDMIHNHNKLRVKLLYAKYLKGTSILEAHHTSGVSPVWNAIVKTVDELKHGFKYRVGKGDLSI